MRWPRSPERYGMNEAALRISGCGACPLEGVQTTFLTERLVAHFLDLCSTMNPFSCFRGQPSPARPPGKAPRAGIDPSKGAKPVRLRPLNASRPNSPPIQKANESLPSNPSSGTGLTEKARAQLPAKDTAVPATRREESPKTISDPLFPPRPVVSSTQKGPLREMTRRPSDVGKQGDPDDPFACTHLTQLMPISPIPSTYRSQSGGMGNKLQDLGSVAKPNHSSGTLPEGIEAPQSRDQNMRRLYVHDEDRVLLKVVHYGNPTSVGIEFDEAGEWQFKPLWTQRAGPRAQIYFQPSSVKAAIVTCGGLCPGLNDVIRQVVFTLDVYGVKEILGIQYGFKGFVDPKYPPVALTRKLVSRLHMAGGSFLGVSRGTPDLNDVVDRLQDWGINFFFVIGGNGSHAGAHEIYKRCVERKMKIAIVGIPKTIDNDLQLFDKTFGFDTSVEEAQRAINAAFVEASSAYNGVGIVKLMGRQSGFIAMYATLASGQVDIVLIPEVPFVLEGESGVYAFMHKRLEKNGLCVVVIAEGAGQELLESSGGVDASGNPILGDIGKWFFSQVKAYFGKIKVPIDVKYIDPTYMIRARHCNSSDHIFCSVLGQNAVHGAFAGYTDITVGLVNTHYVFLPIPKVIEVPRKVDPNSNMWHRTVTSTGQPDFPTQKIGLAVVPSVSSLSQDTSGSKSPKSQETTLSRSQSPEPGSTEDSSYRSNTPTRPQRRISQLSIRIDKNNVQIRSVDNYFKKKTQR